MGVSYYTAENETETLTYLFEITTKKPKKTKQHKTESSKTDLPLQDASETKSDIPGITLKHEEEIKTSNDESKKDDKNDNKDSTSIKSEKTTTNKVRTTVPYVRKTEKYTKKQKSTTVKETQPATTKKSNDKISNETVPEELNGLNIVYKTDTVEKGGDASIMIQGQPGKKYNIKFYTVSSSDSIFTEFDEQTADENGFVTWTFRVPMNCESGNRKIIISDEKSSEHIQTSIKVK